MKNTLLLMGAAAFMAAPTFAQGPNSEVAPNIVMTDIHGVQHDMYADLDAGKTVILDFFATWCGPCIGSLPGLDMIWDDHGPNGDNTMRIYSMEMDPTTSDEAAFESQYNVPNPIFDQGHTVDNIWNISAYPTFIIVCPDRSWTASVGGIGSNPSGLLNIAASCPGPSTTMNDAKVLSYDGAPFHCDGSVTPLITMQNRGSLALTSATIQTWLNGNMIGTSNWTGNLNQYYTTDVALNQVTGLSGNANLEIKIANVNGGNDDDNSDNNITTMLPGVSINAATSTVYFELMTDQYPGETEWKLTDGSGYTVASGGPYSGANTVYSQWWNLDPNQCYSFEITDSYGDGICCAYGNGYYEISSNNTVIISGGAFTDVDGDGFKAGSVTSVSETTLENGLSIYPNPTNGLVNVSLNLVNSELVSVQVFNVLGEMVMSNSSNMAAGAQLEVIDLGALNNGIYYFNIAAGDMSVTRKVTVNK